MSKKGEHPERIRCPPVALVSIDHDSVGARNTLASHQLGKLSTVNVIANHRVIKFGVPVDLDSSGNMTGVIEQNVLVGFDDRKPRRVEILRQPFGGHQPLRVGVVG